MCLCKATCARAHHTLPHHSHADNHTHNHAEAHPDGRPEPSNPFPHRPTLFFPNTNRNGGGAGEADGATYVCMACHLQCACRRTPGVVAVVGLP